MPYSNIENSPININLLTEANTTGWLLPGDGTAVHSCNPGNLILGQYPITAGQSYYLTYIINAISSGYVQVQSNGSNGNENTTAGLKTDTITPTVNGYLSIYANGNCTITAFTIVPLAGTGTTIVYSATNSARRGEAIWSDFRSYCPDFGWSLYTRTIVAYNGQLYLFNNGPSASTNNFFGTQYQSYITFVEAKNAAVIKDFEALSYQANQLLVTSIDGIKTSLGQISTLIDTDFIKQKLSAGGLSVINYNVDNVYSASFLGDENDNNVVNGSSLRGNYVIVELVTNNGSTPLILYSIAVRTRQVFIGSRP